MLEGDRCGLGKAERTDPYWVQLVTFELIWKWTVGSFKGKESTKQVGICHAPRTEKKADGTAVQLENQGQGPEPLRR